MKLAECSGLPLEEQTTGAGHLERQERPGAAEVNQIHAIGPEAGSDGQIERIQISRAVALNGEINVARRRAPPLDRRPEEHEELNVRQRLRKVGELPGSDLRVHAYPHAGNLSDPPRGVKERRTRTGGAGDALPVGNGRLTGGGALGHEPASGFLDTPVASL